MSTKQSVPNNSSSVHPIETSVLKFPQDYKEFRRSSDQVEWEKSEWLYNRLFESGDRDRREAFRNCRGLAWFVRQKFTGEVRVFSNACKLRWCPICSRAKTYHIQESCKQWISGKVGVKFLTLTLKHTNSPLSNQISALYQFFRALRKRKDIASYVRGGVWFFQVTFSKRTEQWHPHLHCLLDSDYIPQAYLKQIWKEITHGSEIVDIKSIHNTDKVSSYVARYCARPCNLKDYDEEQCIEIFNAFHGRRLCGSWGTGSDCKLSNIKSDDIDCWQRVGSYKAVVSQAYSLSRARIILEAWLSKKPVPEYFTIEHRCYTDYMESKGHCPFVGVEDFAGKFEEFL